MAHRSSPEATRSFRPHAAAFILALALGSAHPLLGQGSSSAASWHGLTLDVSTPDDARAALGSPVRENGSRLFLAPATDLYLKGISSSLPSLEFKGTPGIKKVDLFFLDGKLAAIALEPEGRSIDAATLDTVYDTTFHYAARAFESPGRSQALYTLAAVTDKSTLIANIRNALWHNSNPGHFPGSVVRLQLLSHRLDRGAPSKGSDLLK